MVNEICSLNTIHISNFCFKFDMFLWHLDFNYWMNSIFLNVLNLQKIIFMSYYAVINNLDKVSELVSRICVIFTGK